ncbi:MAG: hypothetical protein ACLU37_08070 [Collinsella sp.]
MATDAYDDGLHPAQIYRLTKAGQNVGEAGATQFTRFIVSVWPRCLGAILALARMPFLPSVMAT